MKLPRIEACLEEAQRLSRTGSFSWNVSTGEILWSEETFRIFEYDRTTMPTVGGILRRVHPQDADFVKRSIEDASLQARDFDLEHRLLMPDGSVKHLRGGAHGGEDGPGNIEFVGAVMDVTAAKQAEERIRQDEQELRATIERLQRSEAQLHEAQRLGHMGSSVRNLTTGAFVASPEFLRIFGFDPGIEQPTFEMLRERIHPDDDLDSLS